MAITSDGVSRILASLTLEGFRSRLGLQGCRSRDFEYCEKMICSSKIYIFNILFVVFAGTRNNQNKSEKC